MVNFEKKNPGSARIRELAAMYQADRVAVQIPAGHIDVTNPRDRGLWVAAEPHSRALTFCFFPMLALAALRDRIYL
jgi:hypothetical protein